MADQKTGTKETSTASSAPDENVKTQDATAADVQDKNAKAENLREENPRPEGSTNNPAADRNVRAEVQDPDLNTTDDSVDADRLERKVRFETPESEAKRRHVETERRRKVAQNIRDIHVDGDTSSDHEHSFGTVPGVVVACPCGAVRVEG